MPSKKATTATKKTAATKKVVENKKTTKRPSVLKILRNDPYLAVYADAINGRHQNMLARKLKLAGPSGKLTEFADGHL